MDEGSSSSRVTDAEQPSGDDTTDLRKPGTVDSTSKSDSQEGLTTHLQVPITDDSADSSRHGQQPERSLWKEKVEHRLLIAKERYQPKTVGFQILKLAEYRRQPSEMFTPRAWRFGLHNLNDERYVETETLKAGVPFLFGLDEMEKWKRYCEHVVPDLARMLEYYGLHKEDINLKEEEIKQLLAFDALFIAWHIDTSVLMSEYRKIWTEDYVRVAQTVANTYISSYNTWRNLLSGDLLKVENQIPLELIERAIKNIPTLESVPNGTNGIVEAEESEYLDKCMESIVQFSMEAMFDVDIFVEEISDLRLLESHHILDASYKAICGKKGLERKMDRTQKEYIHIPSATKLKQAGVKIKGEASPLCAMAYDKKTKFLILPMMKIYDDTIAFIRNMARYEEYTKKDKCMFHDYIFLMMDLLDTPEDMEYLIKCGVIHNNCGIRAFDMWKSLDEGLGQPRSSKEHNTMKKDIKRRYNQKLPRLWREFRTLFCSKPWLIVPIIAATLVTIATLIQTYAAVIGSDRMMPRYKNP